MDPIIASLAKTYALLAPHLDERGSVCGVQLRHSRWGMVELQACKKQRVYHVLASLRGMQDLLDTTA